MNYPHLAPFQSQARRKGDDRLVPFTPFPGIKNGIAQTILGSQMAGETGLPPRRLHKVRLAPGNVLACLEIPGHQPKVPLVVMTHGMGGCSESAYMRRIARKLHKQGFGVFMVNQRGSGPGMGLADRLWNGGSSADLARVVDYVCERFPGVPVLLAGFSLSGNLLLKYLGEGHAIPAQVHSALAINPPVDLKAASVAISTGPWSGTFNRYYMQLIHQQVRALAECFPEAFIPPGDPKTIYEFDVAYTAPAGGFRDVEEYYRESSAARFLDQVRVPTTLLCSQDDPFIPPSVFRGLRMSLCVNGVYPVHGGHMGYLSKHTLPSGDRRWMDYFVLHWALDSLPGRARSSKQDAFSVKEEMS